MEEVHSNIKYILQIFFPVFNCNFATFYNYPYDNTDVFVESNEAFLIAEPGVEFELNVARWRRFGQGAGYCFTTTFEPSIFDTNSLDGFTGGFSLKFGKF